jgi:hypothetical protein
LYQEKSGNLVAKKLYWVQILMKICKRLPPKYYVSDIVDELKNFQESLIARAMARDMATAIATTTRPIA